MANFAGPIDFAIQTALPIERDAVLRLIEDHCTIQDDPRSPTYYGGYVKIPGKDERYKVVVVMQPEMANLVAATIATKMIADWQPKYLIMVGIAGGVRKKNIGRGDIVVANFCHYYELEKIQSKGKQLRIQQFRSSRILYDRALAYNSDQWHNDIRADDPKTWFKNDPPKVHFGPIASGEKVIANKSFLNELVSQCPQLLAVAMEGAGVAQATAHCGDSISFIEIRGICDFADEKKDDTWQLRAANAVAAYTIGLLRSRPVPPSQLPLPQSVDQERLLKLQQMLDGSGGMPMDKHKLVAIANNCLPDFKTYSIPTDCQELKCLLNFLGNQIGRLTGGQVPLLCFVNHLIHLVKSSTLKDDLKQWIKTVGKDCFGLTPDEIEKLLESKPFLEKSSANHQQTLPPVLSIVLEPDNEQEIIAKAWFKEESKPLMTANLKRETWKEEISSKLKILIETELYDDLQNAVDPLTIEFFLPIDWLCDDIERLTLENCDPIGVDYRIIIRSQERLKNKAWHGNWHRHWNRCQGILQSAPNTCVAWLESPAQNLRSLLDENKLFFVLTFVPEPGFLTKSIKAGMPLALYARQTTEEVSQKLKTLLSCNRLEELPELVRCERQTTWENSEQLGYFSLFWDNPERLPYKVRKLQTPT